LAQLPDKVVPTVPALVAHRAATAPDDVFMVCDDASISFAQLEGRSRNVSQHLIAAGIGKGDRIGLMMPNGIGWALAAIGILRVGAILVPQSTLLRPPEWLAQINAGDLTALITVRAYRRRQYLDDLNSILPSAAANGPACIEAPSLRRVWVWGETIDATSSSGPQQPDPVVRPADDMVILFSSGSRGRPKGTIHTHGSALRSVAASLDDRCVREGDRLYIPMPFFWVGGLAGGLLTSIVGKVTLLTETSPEPATTISLLKRERVTLFRGALAQVDDIAEHPSFDPADLPELRPGSLDPILPAHLRARPGARANLFGMSETFGPYSGYPLDTDLPPGKAGSCGKPVPGIEVKIVDPDTRESLPPGHQGEIVLRGTNLMRGIWGRERHDVFDADGYYATGDIGVLDEDGFLWFRARRDDMFKVSGATVYPSDVEEGLLAIPGVDQAFVTAVPAGGKHAVGAVIVGAGLDLAVVETAARAALSSFKVPSKWVILQDKADVPRLATGKPDILEMRRRLISSGERIDAD
jgi:acyl-CoA synthetase (AMP-forming)/AMP-acid ligase II